MKKHAIVHHTSWSLLFCTSFVSGQVCECINHGLSLCAKMAGLYHACLGST